MKVDALTSVEYMVGSTVQDTIQSSLDPGAVPFVPVGAQQWSLGTSVGEGASASPTSQLYRQVRDEAGDRPFPLSSTFSQAVANGRASRRKVGKSASIAFKVCSANALSLVDRLPVFIKQVEELDLLLVGVQEARLRDDKAWRDKNMLLVSSAVPRQSGDNSKF